MSRQLDIFVYQGDEPRLLVGIEVVILSHLLSFLRVLIGFSVGLKQSKIQPSNGSLGIYKACEIFCPNSIRFPLQMSLGLQIFFHHFFFLLKEHIRQLPGCKD